MRIKSLVTSLTALLLLAGRASAQTPVDASDRDLIPTIFAEAGADGSLDVAWRASDGRLMLSTFSGSNFSSGRQVQLPTSLNLLGGLARDEAGNRYIAAFRRERASEADWAAGYRQGVANVFKVPAGGNQASLLADINQPQYCALPIINPSDNNGFVVNSEMVYSNGTLTLAFGHNNGRFVDIHSTGQIVALGTDGSAKYSGGAQHPFNIRLAGDGGNFVKAQTFDQGLGLSTLKRSGSGFTFSHFVLVNEVTDQLQEFISIGGIVPTQDSYLLIFANGQGSLPSQPNSEKGIFGNVAIKVKKIARNFDTLEKFDWWPGQSDPSKVYLRKEMGNFPLTTIAAPSAGKTFLRPIVIRVPDGRSIVAYEQWGNTDGAEGVRATMLDANGNVQQHSEFFPGLKIQKSTRGFFLPSIGRVGWVNGEGNRLMLHTLDSGLNLTSIELGASGGNTPSPLPPAPATEFKVTELAGDWNYGDVNTKFSLRANGESVTWIQGGSEWTLSKVAGQQNTFQFPGGAMVKFVSKEAAEYLVSNPPVALKRIGSAAIDPTGNWSFDNGTAPISLRLENDKLKYIDQAGGEFTMDKVPNQPNSYQFPGTEIIVSFTSNDAGTFKNGATFTVGVRRR